MCRHRGLMMSPFVRSRAPSHVPGWVEAHGCWGEQLDWAWWAWEWMRVALLLLWLSLFLCFPSLELPSSCAGKPPLLRLSLALYPNGFCKAWGAGCARLWALYGNSAWHSAGKTHSTVLRWRCVLIGLPFPLGKDMACGAWAAQVVKTRGFWSRDIVM